MAARRKGFTTVSVSRYAKMWRALSPHGHAKLFLVEDEGEAVSGQLSIPFGDTLYSHLMAWSGQHASRKPNELLDWTVMMWAKSHGYRHYDFEGIDDGVAQTVLRGSRASEGTMPDEDSWVSDYKLGFGGRVVPISETYEYVYNPMLRCGYHSVLPRSEHWPPVQRLETRITRLVSGRRHSHAGGEAPGGRPAAPADM